MKFLNLFIPFYGVFMRMNSHQKKLIVMAHLKEDPAKGQLFLKMLNELLNKEILKC